MSAAMPLDLDTVRADFPILGREVNEHRLVYLDSAATSQKPVQVLDAMDRYYRLHNANVHRGVHTLAEEATAAFETARERVAGFVGADRRGTVFTKNATEAVNLVAHAWGLDNLRPGDEILVTGMEHHANLVPWQLVAGRTGARLRAIPVTGADSADPWRLDLEALDGLLTERTRMVALTAASNVLGTVNPVAEVARRAHDVGALVLVDASQAVPHEPVDLGALGADFMVFTGHKMLGPMGIGVLAARPEVLDTLAPFLGGGEMIRDVTLESSTYNDIPWRFEAGTPNVAEAVGLAAAVDWLERVGMDAVRAHEQELAAYALERLVDLPGLDVLGPATTDRRGGQFSFTLKEAHPHDVAQVLDAGGVAVRAGHHCAKPLMRQLGVPATTRASVYVYNGRDDVDVLVDGIRRVQAMFG